MRILTFITYVHICIINEKFVFFSLIFHISKAEKIKKSNVILYQEIKQKNCMQILIQVITAK